MPCSRSVSNRTIKLMVVGREERGKTTLLRRLRQEATDSKLDRTEGIDIHDWTYPTGWKTKMFSAEEPVTFLTWDFAGQVGEVVMRVGGAYCKGAGHSMKEWWSDTLCCCAVTSGAVLRDPPVLLLQAVPLPGGVSTGGWGERCQ